MHRPDSSRFGISSLLLASTALLMIVPGPRTEGQTLEPIFVLPLTDRGLATSIDGPGITVVGTIRVVGGPAREVYQVTVWTHPSWVPTQITNLDDDAWSVSVSNDGQFLTFVSRADPFGTNHDRSAELFGIHADGTQIFLYDVSSSQLSQLSTLAPSTYFANPTINVFGTTIAFEAFAGNGPGIRTIRSNGTNQAGIGAGTHPTLTENGLTVYYSSQIGAGGANLMRRDSKGLTPTIEITTAPSEDESPLVSSSGNRLLFRAEGEYPGAFNPDGGWESLVLDANGTNAVQLTDIETEPARLKASSMSSDATTLVGLVPEPTPFFSEAFAADAGGNWVVFQSLIDYTSEIYRARVDGSVIQMITTDPDADSRWPHQSDDGAKIVFSSEADPLGLNPEGNQEIFLYDTLSSTTTQLTQSVTGESYAPLIIGDGSVVYFNSDVDFFEPNSPLQQFKLDLGSGAIERAGGVEYRTFCDGRDWREYEIECDPAGRFCYGTSYLIDYDAPARISVGAGSPTLVRWNEEPRPLRYDVIRGDVANLSADVGGLVDLGPVVCIENDSPDTDTAGFEDPLQPGPGQTLFYLRRGSQGTLDATATWGFASSGARRDASAGDCAYP